jgi:murein DD-endopeptidase MepM/ murein hydrolase activator NlpD
MVKTQARRLPKVAAISILFSMVSCATFKGPGPLVLGGAPAASQNDLVEQTTQNERHPALTLTGERTFSRTDSSIAFDWPVDEARLTRGFLSAAANKKRPHWGLDLANKKHTPILASAAGEVVYTGQGFKGYGKLIVVEHGDDWATLYSHLDRILVKEGQKVTAGEKIGLMGRTGRATGNHLHFEIRHFRQPVNPLAFLPQGSDKPRYAGMPRAGSIRLSQQEVQEEEQSEE